MPLQKPIKIIYLNNYNNLHLHTVLECKNILHLLSHLLIKTMLQRKLFPMRKHKYPNNFGKGVPHKNNSKREKKNEVFSISFLSHNLYSLPLPFGVISATKSSTVTCSSPFSLITSYAKAKNKSYHLKSLSVRKIFIEEGLRSCF